MSIVILDACRDNPFERKFGSTGGGLVQMDAPKSSLIAYATTPRDGESRNGLSQELLKHSQMPGLPLTLLRFARHSLVTGIKRCTMKSLS